MFRRILSSSRVQTAFAGLLAAILVTVAGGALDEATAKTLAETFLAYVIPVLLAGTAIEDAAEKRAATGEHPDDVPPPLER